MLRTLERKLFYHSLEKIYLKNYIHKKLKLYYSKSNYQLTRPSSLTQHGQRTHTVRLFISCSMFLPAHSLHLSPLILKVSGGWHSLSLLECTIVDCFLACRFCLSTSYATGDNFRIIVNGPSKTGVSFPLLGRQATFTKTCLPPRLRWLELLIIITFIPLVESRRPLSC